MSEQRAIEWAEKWTEWALLRLDGSVAAGPVQTEFPETWASGFTPYPKAWKLHSRMVQADPWRERDTPKRGSE